jgi:hypothetical protein
VIRVTDDCQVRPFPPFVLFSFWGLVGFSPAPLLIDRPSPSRPDPSSTSTASSCSTASSRLGIRIDVFAPRHLNAFL